MIRRTKMIATDLDGTLFNADSEISNRTLLALEQAKDAGFHTVAVTGRSWRTASDKLTPASGIDYVICSNGAYLYQQQSASIGWSNAISVADLPLLLSTVRDAVPQTCFGWESASGLFFEPAFTALSDNPAFLEKGGHATELGSEDLYKLFIRSSAMDHHQLHGELIRTVGNIATLATSGAPFLEATSIGTDKATALARLTSELGVTAENTITFGDNMNDIPMLKWSGTSVAMGNALPTVKAVTTDHTESNVNDGVAVYLEHLLITNNSPTRGTP